MLRRLLIETKAQLFTSISLFAVALFYSGVSPLPLIRQREQDLHLAIETLNIINMNLIISGFNHLSRQKYLIRQPSPRQHSSLLCYRPPYQVTRQNNIYHSSNGCGNRICTCDLLVMSQVSYYFSIPRQIINRQLLSHAQDPICPSFTSYSYS